MTPELSLTDRLVNTAIKVTGRKLVRKIFPSQVELLKLKKAAIKLQEAIDLHEAHVEQYQYTAEKHRLLLEKEQLKIEAMKKKLEKA